MARERKEKVYSLTVYFVEHAEVSVNAISKIEAIKKFKQGQYNEEDFNRYEEEYDPNWQIENVEEAGDVE